VATRAAQEAEILTPAQALAFVERHGVVCEAARRSAIPSLVDAIAGEPVRGNWWSHPKGRLIFALTRAVRDAPGICVCRLVDGKITFIHERLWPALVRIAAKLPKQHLARVREVHSASGEHVLEEIPFPDWLPAAVSAEAKRLSEAAAHEALRAIVEDRSP
jgi:hypothetical protein